MRTRRYAFCKMDFSIVSDDTYPYFISIGMCRGKDPLFDPHLTPPPPLRVRPALNVHQLIFHNTVFLFNHFLKLFLNLKKIPDHIGGIFVPIFPGLFFIFLQSLSKPSLSFLLFPYLFRIILAFILERFCNQRLRTSPPFHQ